MVKSTREWVSRLLTALESRWNLYNLVTGSSLVASFALPAWAAHAAQFFSQYAPFSWVVAGFCGVVVWTLVRLLWIWGYRIRVTAAYDAKLLESGSLINPIDMTFERKRIFLNEFVLPSWTFIDGKTFIDCDLIGPANMYFNFNNLAHPIRPPKIDAVWLGPDATFFNGFMFTNCIFRNCSFQRITMFASIENYEQWKDNENINWISLPPTNAHIERRKQVIAGGAAALEVAKHAKEAQKLLEDKANKPEPSTPDVNIR